MAEQRTGTVFISYRRQDSAWPARQLYEALAARFGASNIFKDVDDIEPGEDFVDKITGAVAQCDVLLALIGPQWMTMTDAQGRRRLDDPEDFVRVEIGAALARGVRVIPILIDGAPMPAANELSLDLAPMVRRQAVAIDPVSFNTERLFGGLADMFESQRKARADATAAQAAADRAEAETARAEEVRAEAARAEAAQAEVARAERARTEAARAEAAQAEAAQAEAARRETAPAETAAAEQAPAETAAAEQAPSEKVAAEQAPAEQAPLEQDRAEPARAQAAHGEQGRAEPGRTERDLMESDPTKPAGTSASTTASVGGHPGAPPPDRLTATPGPTHVTTPRTPTRVLVAAAVAVALIAIVLIWRPWQSSGGSAGAPLPATQRATQPGTPQVSASATTSSSPSASAGVHPSGPDAVWAHRGGLEEHQFETEEAMEAAARAGFGVETDVRYTSDGVAVLIHDEAATKGLDCGGKDIQVSKTTWATLQKTCRSKPTATDPHTYDVPRFAATMESIAAASRTAWVYPEIKTDLSEAQTRKFLDVLIDAGLRDRVAVTSSSRERLALVRKLEPTLPTVLFVSGKRVDAADLAGDKLWGVAVEKSIATKAYVRQLQANGSKVVLWLLNDEQQFEWADKLGADNVLTDYPNAYRTWSAAR